MLPKPKVAGSTPVRRFFRARTLLNLAPSFVMLSTGDQAASEAALLGLVPCPGLIGLRRAQAGGMTMATENRKRARSDPAQAGPCGRDPPAHIGSGCDQSGPRVQQKGGD